MDGEIVLYPCAALKAKITERQCARNFKAACTASRFIGNGNGAATRLSRVAAATCLGLQACIGCPGVKHLHTAREANVLDGDALVARAKAARPIRQVIAGSPVGYGVLEKREGKGNRIPYKARKWPWEARS